MKTRRIIGDIIVYLLLIVLCAAWILPIVWLILQSFSGMAGSGSYTKFVPTQLSFNNYIGLFTNQYPIYERIDGLDVLKSWGISNYVFFFKVGANGTYHMGAFLNTLIVAIFTSVASTLLTLATAYAFSRFRFKARPVMMRIILILGMFPGFLSLIVLYQVFKAAGLVQNIWALIIVYSGGAGMNYYISKGFFDTISKQIDEAAMVDGASRFQIFYKITMPLSKPIIVYTILTSFMSPWGEYITAKYLLGGSKDGGSNWTVAVMLKDMLKVTDGTLGKYWGEFCAGAVVVAVPVAIVFMCMQKNYVSGVTGGAVKG